MSLCSASVCKTNHVLRQVRYDRLCILDNRHSLPYCFDETTTLYMSNMVVDLYPNVDSHRCTIHKPMLDPKPVGGCTNTRSNDLDTLHKDTNPPETTPKDTNDACKRSFGVTDHLVQQRPCSSSQFLVIACTIARGFCHHIKSTRSRV